MHKITVCHCVFSVYTGYTHNKPICCLPVPCFGSLPLCLTCCDPVRRRGVTWVVPCCVPLCAPRCVFRVEGRPWRVAPWRGGLLGLVCLLLLWLVVVSVVSVVSVVCVVCVVSVYSLCLLFGSFQSVSWKFDFWISVDCVLFCVVVNCLCLLLEVSSL